MVNAATTTDDGWPTTKLAKAVAAGAALARLNDALHAAEVRHAQGEPAEVELPDQVPEPEEAPRSRLWHWIESFARGRRGRSDARVSAEFSAGEVTSGPIRGSAATAEAGRTSSTGSGVVVPDTAPASAGPAEALDTSGIERLLLRDDVMQIRIRELEATVAGTATTIEELTGSVVSLRRKLRRFKAIYQDGETMRRAEQAAARRARDADLKGHGEPAMGTAALVKLDNLAQRQEAIIEQGDLLLQRHLIGFGDRYAIRSNTGYLLAPGSDIELVLSLTEAHGCLERGTLAIILDLLQPGDTVIDVGANVGSLTLPMAQALRGSGHVVAIEPIPEVCDLLTATIAINGLTDEVSIQRCLAGDHDGLGVFYVMPKRVTHSSSWGEDKGEAPRIEVAIRTLDSLVAPGTSVRLIKIDVEGDELSVWAGMSRLIAENPEMVVILEFGPSHLKARGISSEHWLDSIGVNRDRIWEIAEQDGTLRPLRKQGLAEVASLNLLVAHSGLPVQLGHRLR